MRLGDLANLDHARWYRINVIDCCVSFHLLSYLVDGFVFGVGLLFSLLLLGSVQLRSSRGAIKPALLHGTLVLFIILERDLLPSRGSIGWFQAQQGCSGILFRAHHTPK